TFDVAPLPTVSEDDTVKVFAPALDTSIAAPTGVVPVQLATPEPPSVHVYAAATVWPSAYRVAVGAVIAIDGVRLSTRLPAIGPTVVQFPATSQTSCAFVDAFVVSVSAATFVTSENAASDGVASPDPASLAVQAIATSVACQALSLVPQATAAGVR